MDDGQFIACGRTADIFEYGSGQVLKLFKPHIPEAVIQEEYDMSKAVYSLGVQAPKPLEMVKVGQYVGIVYERVEGRTMLQEMTSRPWRMIPLARKMADLHFGMHGHTASMLYRKQKDALRAGILNATLLSMEERETIVKQLNHLPEQNKLCHGDFHPINVIMGEGEWIIDWMTGMAGNPAGDAARTILLLRMGTLPEGMSRSIRLTVQLIRHSLIAN